jgi:hypothetical protein
MTHGFLPIALSVLLSVGTMPLAFSAGEPQQLNFKIYSPDGASNAPAKSDEAPAASEEKASTAPSAEAASADSTPAEKSNDLTSKKATAEPEAKSTQLTKEEPAMSPTAAASTTADTDTAPTVTPTASETKSTETPAASAFDTSTGDKPAEAASTTGTAEATETATADKKVLQGYIREVPAQTKIPIIMDTAVDSDTSQEGDEFAARTSEDLMINGAIVVPAGSIIKGRIAQLNAPKHFTKGGSVALKFDTVTTPDNRQIPLVANLVAHGGVVHARRGVKDIAIDAGIVSAPFLAGILIGVMAGKSTTNNNTTTTTTTSTTKSSGISKGAAAALGAGIGLAVGVAILCAKKGKKVDVRPGDELKIELAEALRMPMM